MTKTTKISWVSAKGQTLEATIEVTREMKIETAYADGWNVELGKKLYEHMTIVVELDGKFVTRDYNEPSVITGACYKADIWSKVKAQGGYALLGDNVVLKEDTYNKIMAAIEEMKIEVNKDEEVVAHDAKEVARVDAQDQKIEEMKAITIPLYAMEAYNMYSGSSEKAWEDEDETAWALIEKWGKYIEVQQGIHPERVREMMNEAGREQSFRIHD